MDSRVLALIFALVMFLLTYQGRATTEKPFEKVATIAFGNETMSPQKASPAEPSSAIPSPIPTPATLTIPFFKLQAEDVGLFELSSGKIIVAKNIESPHPIASITKLMTAVVAVEALGKDDPITLSVTDLALENHNANLAPGDTLTLSEALYFMLISSDNSVAQATSRAAAAKVGDFTSAMNREAQKLGMAHTAFSNPTGLDGNLSTPYDLFLLSQYIAKNHPELFDTSRQAHATLISRQGKIYELKTTDELLGRVPGILGGKTGYTPEAAGSLLLYFEVGKSKVVSIVLDSGDRFGDTEKLVHWYRENYNS